MQINELFDQSVFVKQSVTGVLREGAIAAALTALMILLFLGSWRSTVVVMISIPLAILTSLKRRHGPEETAKKIPACNRRAARCQKYGQFHEQSCDRLA
jgi:hypothetical protein